jgi:hypothetical protein
MPQLLLSIQQRFQYSHNILLDTNVVLQCPCDLLLMSALHSTDLSPHAVLGVAPCADAAAVRDAFKRVAVHARPPSPPPLMHIIL